MTSPAHGTGQQVNFQTNVNRAKTKRWVEAKSYAYDGDDWGDGDEYDDEADGPAQPDPQSATGRPPNSQIPIGTQQSQPGQQHPGPRYGDLSSRGPGQFGNRTATNPPPIHTRNQGSYDRGDDRRAFSAGGFEGPYPTTQRAPFSATEQFPQYSNTDPRMGPRGPNGPLGPQRGRGPSFDQEGFSRPTQMHDGRGGQYQEQRSGPYPGPMGTGRRSESGGRPPFGDMHDRRNSPSRATPLPSSAVSQGSRDGSPGKSFPLRKSSLSQQSGPADFQVPTAPRDQGSEPDPSTKAVNEEKPLPFIRPADIYKRMAEERERERRASEESSRPSVDGTDSQKQGHKDLTSATTGAGEPLVTQSSSPQGAPIAAGVASTINDSSNRGFAQSGDALEKTSTIQAGHLSAPKTLSTQPSEPKDASSLTHTPSAGFTSVVHKAFDDSQTQVAPTPTSVSGDSVLRSNSASTSGISPIIDSNPVDPSERPLSSATLTPRAEQPEGIKDSDPLPPPVRPGYRRDRSTPSPGNSPARRPLSVTTGGLSQEELGVLSSTTPTESKALPQTPPAISRSESPTKGTVRDLANKLETRSSPSGSPTLDAARPVNPRLESFRPQLPGAWNSYTSTGQSSPVRETPQAPPAVVAARPKTPESEVRSAAITAGPPKPIAEEWGTSGKAFEALSAAGAALTGAFGAPSAFRQDGGRDDDLTPEPQSDIETPDTERAGGLSPVPEVFSVGSSVAPTPAAKDTPAETHSTAHSYFPSPLRTVKTNDSPDPRPRILPALSTETSPHDTESDRLRKEIVLSLSPIVAQPPSDLNNDRSKPTLTQAPNPLVEAPLPVSSQQPTGGNHLRNESAFSQYTQGSEPEAGRLGPSRIPSGPPMLQKKFSWERSSHKADSFLDESASSVHKEPTDQGIVQHTDAPLQPAVLANEPKETQQVQDAQVESKSSPENSPTLENRAMGEKPEDPFSAQYIPETQYERATVIPVARSSENLHKEAGSVPTSPHQPNVRQSLGSDFSTRRSAEQEPIAFLPERSMEDLPAQPSPSHIRVAVPPETPFRDILAMKTPQERIRAFKNSRESLADQESQLDLWIQNMGSQNKELQDFILANGRQTGSNAPSPYTHKPSGSKTKFNRVGSNLGAGSQQASDAHTPSRPSPSGGKISTQQMQSEGKKLLHSAGKFGGKAGGTAKGLFAKGKSKLRGSSGAGDKVD